MLSGDAKKHRGGASMFDDRALRFARADATTDAGLLDGVAHCYVANLCFDDAASARLGAALAAAPSVRRGAALESLGGADVGLGRHRKSLRPKLVVDANLQAQPEPESLGTLAGTLTLTAKLHARMTWNTLPDHAGTDVLLYGRYEKSLLLFGAFVCFTMMLHENITLRESESSVEEEGAAACR